MANVSFRVFAGYSTLEECENFVLYAQSLLDLIKDYPTSMVVEAAAAKKMLKESIAKANEWWLANGGLDTVPEDLR